MIDLKPIIERIRALLAEDTDQSVTYAALEARLALEKVCYDRLRQRHDYISHDQLRKWQPGGIINILIADVDQHVADGVTISISREPYVEGVDPKNEDFVEIGTERGFNPKLVTKLWNALANLALHVRLPEHRDDHIPQYGNKQEIGEKVREVLTELDRLALGTMSFSGVGNQLTFICTCGEVNKRRSDLVQNGQHVYCINPKCKETWKAIREEDGSFGFEQITIPVNCQQCSDVNHIPWRHFFEMRHDQYGAFHCRSCKFVNHVQWRLMQIEPKGGGGTLSSNEPAA